MMKQLSIATFFIFLFSIRFSSYAQTIVVKAAHMLDVRKGVILTPAVIIVKDGVIEEINPKRLPAGAATIDLGNKFLLPGLIDMHVHLASGDSDYQFSSLVTESAAHVTLRSARNAQRDLLAGFTTLRAIGQDHPSLELIDVEIMKAIDGGIIDGPRIVPAGHAISITGGHGDLSMWENFTYGILENGYKHGIADGGDEIVKAVRYQIKHGAKLIKVMATAGILSLEGTAGAQQYSVEELNVAVKEASRHGVKVAAHAHGTEGIIAASNAGVASIEHASILTDEAIRALLKNGTYIVPTAYLNEPHDISFLPLPMQKKAEQMMPIAIESHRKAIKAGVKFAFGTDAGLPKEIAHGENAKEFSALVRLGMTTIEAIRTATIHANELLGTGDRGELKKGMLGDIIAVDGNPLLDITTLEKVSFVMKGGKVYLHNQK
jgi:imidazolonepropionase-like amidohydrolase